MDRVKKLTGAGKAVLVVKKCGGRVIFCPHDKIRELYEFKANIVPVSAINRLHPDAVDTVAYFSDKHKKFV